MKFLVFHAVISLTLAIIPARFSGKEKSVMYHGMAVSWEYDAQHIHIKMRAPTQGWIAIGFNDQSGLKNTYLVMGRIVDDKPEIVEHFTFDVGEYRPLADLGIAPSFDNLQGRQTDLFTELTFSLPTEPNSPFQKNLREGKSINLLMAYSRDKDFQHHSIMRTSKKLEL